MKCMPQKSSRTAVYSGVRRGTLTQNDTYVLSSAMAKLKIEQNEKYFAQNTKSP